MKTPKDPRNRIAEILVSCRNQTYVEDGAGAGDLYVNADEATEKIAKWIEGMGIMKQDKQEKSA